MLRKVVTKSYPQDFFVEAHISDIHFGVMDPEITYWILQKQFVEPLSQMQVLDIISIDGDLFDHKFMANSSAIMYAMYFVQSLIDICRQKNATLLLISGTGAHDADQMKLFYPFMKLTDVDVRVIMNVKFEYVKGKKILCIPELYNKGEDYYNFFLFKSGFYDACYMHGCYVGAIFGKNEPNLDSNREPVFSMNDFVGCRGPIISGHNHVHSIWDKDFYYCGSPIRWRFGEESDKGWILLCHNIRSKWYHVHFEPIISFRYETIKLGEILKSDPNTIIQYINAIKESGIDYLRIQFDIEDKDKIALLRSYYHGRRDIVLDNSFNQNFREEIKNQLDDVDEEQQQLIETITNPNISPEEKLVIYMNNKEKDSCWTIDLFKRFMEDIKNI